MFEGWTGLLLWTAIYIVGLTAVVFGYELIKLLMDRRKERRRDRGE